MTNRLLQLFSRLRITSASRADAASGGESRHRRAHPVPIVLAFDDHFAKYAAVTIKSILVHSLGSYRFFCLSQNLGSESRELLSRVVESASCTINFLDLAGEIMPDWKAEHHFGIANYYRIYIPQKVESAKALYLDSDVLVTCAIDELLDVCLSDFWIGGCVDRHGSATTMMPLARRDLYINSGVMLMDLSALRANLFSSLCIDAHQSYLEHVTYADQCLINKVAEGKILLLDERWNVQATHFPRDERYNAFSQRLGRSVLHFSGPRKPWMAWTDPRLAEIWFAYATTLELPRSYFTIAE